MPDLAVIFDMDGVLVDSYEPHFQSWQRLYDELGIEYSEAAFAADFGQTSRDILRRRFPEELTEARFREIDDRKESYYRDIIRESFPAMNGADDLIEALAADGFQMAVGSSGPPENVRARDRKAAQRTADRGQGDGRGRDARQARSASLFDGGRATGRAAGVVCGDRGCDSRRRSGQASRHGGDRAHGHFDSRRIGGR